MNKWSELEAELDKWADQGLAATFWWRDDDAVRACPELDRLKQESVQAQASLLLAAIPLNVDSTLVKTLESHPNIVIAQHGYAHINHAPRGQESGAWELGLHRGEGAVMNDLQRGHEILSALFEDKFIPVVAPPWNRIDHDLYDPMSKSGYKGVSAYGQCETLEPLDNFIQMNCHCDPIKWKGGARFTGEDKSIMMVCRHLKFRRTNPSKINEATGLLTHHLDMDEDSWGFVSKLAQNINQHCAAKWCHPIDLFNI